MPSNKKNGADSVEILPSDVWQDLAVFGPFRYSSIQLKRCPTDNSKAFTMAANIFIFGRFFVLTSAAASHETWHGHSMPLYVNNAAYFDKNIYKISTRETYQVAM